MSAAQRAGQRATAAAKPDAKSGQKLQGKLDLKPEAPADPVTRRVEKSPAAFRTISEVAEELDVPQHVLRFWESKFPQVRPLKRGGGRRYYRPEDVELLARIRQLLYADGYTIKGVQRLMREGALRPKREAPHAEAAAAEAVEPGDVQEAPAAVLEEDVRAELEGLLNELLALREELRRVAG